MKRRLAWFKTDVVRHRVVARSACRTCGKPIVLGSGLDVWLHEARIRFGTCFRHEALPAGGPKQNRSGEHGTQREQPRELP